MSCGGVGVEGGGWGAGRKLPGDLWRENRRLLFGATYFAVRHLVQGELDFVGLGFGFALETGKRAVSDDVIFLCGSFCDGFTVCCGVSLAVGAGGRLAGDSSSLLAADVASSSAASPLLPSAVDSDLRSVTRVSRSWSSSSFRDSARREQRLLAL